MRYSSFWAALPTCTAARDGRTFAVLRFQGNKPLMEARLDPIAQPGVASSHVHTIMGGSNFGAWATGETLMRSDCSNALVAGDRSAYWYPKLYFYDRLNGSFESVDLYYMNVYYL